MNNNNTFYFHLSTADLIGVGFFKYQITPEAEFIIINSACASILGYSNKADVEKKSLYSLFVHSEQADTFFQQLQAKEKVRFLEVQFLRGDGSAIWVAISAALIRNEDRDYIEGIIEDITAHHEMEEKLALERDYMNNLLENIPDAIYFKDRENRITKVNKYYAQGRELEPHQIIGKTDYDFYSQEVAQKMAEDDSYVVNTGKPIIGKIERIELPGGSWSQVITTKIPMHDSAGNVIGTMGITRDMTAYARLERERFLMVMTGLNVLVKALEMRDPYTFSHTRHVANIVECIAKEFGWNDDRILGLRLSAELHDLGKISVPLEILNKPGVLSELEYRLIQEHVIRCHELIKDISFPFPLVEAICQHHERMDGSGYPYQLQGDQIMLEARILAVSDVLEAMTHHRPYRAALGLDQAKEELQQGSGSRYDSHIVETVLHLLERNGPKPFWLYA